MTLLESLDWQSKHHVQNNHKIVQRLCADARDEIIRLREAAATAVLPLEAIRMAGSEKFHSPEVREAIAAGVKAVRFALAESD